MDAQEYVPRRYCMEQCSWKKAGGRGVLLFLAICGCVSLASLQRVLSSLPLLQPTVASSDGVDYKSRTSPVSRQAPSAPSASNGSGHSRTVQDEPSAVNTSLLPTVIGSGTRHASTIATNSQPAAVNALDAAENPDKRWKQPSDRIDALMAAGWPDDPTMIQRLAVNKTVIVFIATCPYLTFLANAIASAERIGYTNYIIVPLDYVTHENILLFWPDHVTSVPPFSAPDQRMFSKPAKFKTKPFQALTSSRAVLLHAILRQCQPYNIKLLYSDVDGYWQSPLAIPYLQQLSAKSTSIFSADNGNYDTSESRYDIVGVLDSNTLKQGLICSGFLYLQPTESTFWFLSVWDSWIQTGRFPTDQHAVYRAYEQVREMSNSSLITANLPTFRLLDPDNKRFPVGKVYFEESSETTRSMAYWIHNNWIRSAPAKRARFQRHGLWAVPESIYKIPNRAECGI